MRKIVPGLYTFTDLVLGRVYLIRDPDGLTIIDAGLPFAAGRIIGQIRAAGYEPGAVKRILVTHGHPDHVGGLPHLREITGAQVIASARERAVIEGRAPIKRKPLEKLSTLERLARPPRVTLRGSVVDRTVDDGDVLPEVMGGLRVIATPGHTPGQISFWHPDRRILFCGDVIAAGLWMRLPSPSWTVDMEENRRSIKRLAGLEAEIVCFGHGLPLMQDAAERMREFAHRVCDAG
jgi:glyoxylase-like metal-dependent hydrolase (beta-lactamase superfamily II)